jgi:TPR repeat protein
MALLDFEGVKAQECEARLGKPDAFYMLGLAYSTGQGVTTDLVEAHKWFNLAAMKGIVEAREKRAEISAELGPDGIAEAQRSARAWLQTIH